jgi:hypothetical protein
MSPDFDVRCLSLDRGPLTHQISQLTRRSADTFQGLHDLRLKYGRQAVHAACLAILNTHHSSR